MVAHAATSRDRSLETARSPSRAAVFTTIANWSTSGLKDITWRGKKYLWSKSREFLRFVSAPKEAGETFEMATNIDDAKTRRKFERNGWRLTSPLQMSVDYWLYRDYIQRSKGEFTVAKDQYVRLNTGWFSDRSACYLAAGRLVITQETGFTKLRRQRRTLVISNGGRSRRCREKNQRRLRKTFPRRSRLCPRSLRSRNRARNQFSIGPGSEQFLPSPPPHEISRLEFRNNPSHDVGMKIATIIARVLLGLVFVVFGSNIFLHFIPMPPPPPGLLGDFTEGPFPEPLPSRRRRVPNSRRLAPAHRTLRPSRFGFARSRHCEH